MKSSQQQLSPTLAALLIAGAWAPSVYAQRAQVVQVVCLRTEYKQNPVGVDSRKPRLSWQLQSGGRGVTQSAYQVRVARSERDVRSGSRLLWDSGRVNSDESIHRAYDGPSLQSRWRYYWQVRVWDGNGNGSSWSEPAYWEMGLLDPAEWRANWIEPDLQEDASKAGPVAMLRREFKVNGVPALARAYVTSRGLYEMYLNGRRVGDQLFTPGWTSYNKRLQYQAYDVTDGLKSGTNAIGVLVGNGWYRFRGRHLYGERLALLVQVNIIYEDGREEIIGSDQNWKSTTGPILMSV